MLHGFVLATFPQVVIVEFRMEEDREVRSAESCSGVYQSRKSVNIPAATKIRSRITPMISSRRARFSCPGFGMEIPMKETNIQKRERRGSDFGSSGLGLGVPGSTGLTIKEKTLGFRA